jgi:spore maturation protein CgeB
VKILYASQLSAIDSALYRLWALERLGHTVVPVNLLEYVPRKELLRQLALRLQAGLGVRRMNSDLVALAERERPDVFWADKALGVWPETVEAMRRMGIASVSYMIDNAFGPRRDPGWRLYVKCLPAFDLHAVQRDKNVEEYMERGARDVIKIQTAYEPTVHFPPPEGWSDQERDRAVSFIGTPYDDRGRFLTRLWKEFGIAVAVSGGLIWKKALGPEASAGIYRGHGELYGKEYREGIWRSKINLSFITHSNMDEFVHKSFEIAACEGFLLAERSAGHSARFAEDEEAVFFSGIEECVEKIRKYLPDEAARTRIAAAGRARAVRGGYGNDAQVARIVERIEKVVARGVGR